MAKCTAFYHTLYLLSNSTTHYHKQKMPFFFSFKHYRLFFYKSFEVQQCKFSHQNRPSNMKLNSNYKTLPLNKRNIPSGLENCLLRESLQPGTDLQPACRAQKKRKPISTSCRQVATIYDSCVIKER